MNEEPLKILEEMKIFENNWNNYNVRPILIEVIEKTEKFVRQLNDEIEVFPTGRQTIQIEKENKFGYFEIEVYSDKMMLFFASSNREEFIEKEVNEREAFEFIDNFMSMSYSFE